VQPGASTPGTAPSGALDILLRQARYWREQNQPDRAMAAAQRALELSPNNPAALGLIAEIQASGGQLQEAQQTLDRLQQNHSSAPQIQSVQQAIRMGSINPRALQQARQLAQDGQSQQAVVAYRNLFGGGKVPDSLAVEYYQTLGATSGGYDAALAGLAAAARRDPNDLRAQLAYAQALTYRDATRTEGISRLADLARIPSISEQARQSWRQAIGWLPANKSSTPEIEAYLAQYPEDGSVKSLLSSALNPPNQAPSAQAAGNGYDAFHRGDYAAAEQAFRQALAANPKDASAMAGLGLTLLREGKAAEAKPLLDQAIALDPAHAAGLRQALAGAETSGTYAAAQAAAKRGDLVTAERLYRQLLRADPGNAGTILALAGVLQREGNLAEAHQLLTQLQATGNAKLAGEAQAQLLAQQAQGVSDMASKVALLRSAVDANPSSPWTRLDLARALVANGHQQEAESVMAAVTGVAHPLVEALQAGIIFANETHNSSEALALVERVPPRQRTAEMRAILEQAQVEQQIASAFALAPSDPASARQQLLLLAAAPDPSGIRGLTVAKAFVSLSDPADATAAITAAAASNPTADAAARLRWAQGLLAAGNTAGASAMLAAVAPSTLTTADRQNLADLRRGIAIRSSDSLNTAGRTADAYDALAPALARNPEDPALNAALGRLYQSADEPRQALAINERILATDPTNADALRGAVAAAVQLGDWSTASALVTQSMAQAPNDPENWILAADIAQGRGLQQAALHDLRQARALRQQQLGYAAIPAGAEAGAYPMAATALGAVSANPFRNSPDTSPSPGANPFAAAGLVTTASLPAAWLATPAGTPAGDPMIADIDTRITTIKTAIAPYVGASSALDFRSGSAGTSQLATFGVPIKASFSPSGVGRVTMTATPTYLNAGTVGSGIYDLEQFGSAVFTPTTQAFRGVSIPDPGTQTATGVGLDLSYKQDWLKADIGSTPLGFAITNIVGGAEIAPKIGPNLVFRLTGERRAVTDSLLAYAGAYDPGSGTTWGGVTRTRVHGQLEFSPGLANFYAGGGYDWLQGQNVMSNTELELGAGGSYPVYKTPSDQVSVGLDLIYFGYSKNEDHFTLGYGGYFSPQTYVAAVLPVNWSATRGDLSFNLGASVGLQSFNADSGLVFPSNPDLQAALGGLSSYYASQNINVQTSYPSQNVAGFVGGLSASFEYHLSPMLAVGGAASYQKSADWNDAAVTAFARYTFVDSQ
jgi:tetratricopeptide (TPR) repeat protein